VKQTLAILAVLAALQPAAASDFRGASFTVARADWDTAAAELRPIAPLAPADDETTAGIFARLNAATAERFPGINASTAPVLLPLDIETYLRDRAAGEAHPTEHYLGGLKPPSFFLAGPAGYDAVFTLRTADIRELASIGFVDPVYVTVSASTLLYELPPPVGAIELQAPREQAIPGLRRLILENFLRYAFERYGVPYVISIYCFDGPPRARRLSCRQADQIAAYVLRMLHLAGGNPAATPPSPDNAALIARPQALSPDFTYYPAGHLLPGTAMRSERGSTDGTVYAQIRFPLAAAPAYANSQSFMDWGDCDHTGRVGRVGRKGAPYRCRISDRPLVFDESSAANRSYPWRDNFCEHRFFFVGECPAGLGHQGQDIRPATCKLRNDGADRCEPGQDDVVAVRDGMIFRPPKQEALYLVVNTANEHIRFRYMHMDPRQMDTDGLSSGRRVREGETIGQVGNYNERPNGTTYHLHFEAHVFTRNGWVRVNPYMTLVSAYERLLGARGKEIDDEPAGEMRADNPAATPAGSALAATPKTKPHPDIATGERSLHAARHHRPKSKRIRH
jgi:murein DD-endopeptidase MepM/ murein hydrolase activator NlpD